MTESDLLKRLESIFRAAPVVIGLVKSRIIVDANDLLFEMTGYDRKEIIGKSSLILYPTREEFERVGREKYAKIEKTGLGTIETVWKHKNGSLIDVLLSSTMIDRDDPERGYTFSAMNISGRKRALKRLLENEKRFKRMLTVLPDMISVHSPAMNILYSNWQGLAAVPESKRIIGTKCHKTYRGYDDVCPDCRAKEVLESGKPLRSEAQLPDGSWYDVRVLPIIDEQGNVEAFMEWARNITQEKQARKDRETNLDLLQIAGETARFGGWSVDLETLECTWSDAVADIHGMPHGFSPKVDESFSFYAPEWRERIATVFKACADEGIPYDEEMEIINSQGRRVWVKTIGRAVKDETGKVIRVHGSFQDISEIKKTEEELLMETERMDFLLKATQTNINIMNSDYSLTYVDQRWQKTYGDFQGRKCYEYYMDANRPCEGCGVPQAIETGETVITEEYLPKEDRFVEVHTIPFREEDGRWMVAEFNVDITQRRKGEEEREKLRFQLQQAHKMESIGRLAGGVAHDFNNMLGVILGNAEMALEKLQPSDPLFAELTEISRAASRSADLTGQLLTFARKQTIEVRLIDLSETVEGMLLMLRRLVGENIRLSWNPGGELSPVKMDPTQLDQLLANLVVNARDAIEDTGRINIETRTRTVTGEAEPHEGELSPGEYVVLSITDDGCGMDRKTQNHLFEPFYTTKEEGRGTGLGLATVYGIVKQNEGFIDVKSEPGRGTSICVFLPARKNETVQTLEKERKEPYHGGGETILLVEDEQSLLNLTRIMLEKLDYTVIPAETPKKAERLAKKHGQTIDLLITDVVMPDMNGRELSIELQDILSGLRTLYISGYTAEVISHNNILDQKEDVCFLSKPFTLGQLAEAVRKALEQSLL